MVNEAADEYDPKLTELKAKLARAEKKAGMSGQWDQIRLQAYPKKPTVNS